MQLTPLTWEQIHDSGPCQWEGRSGSLLNVRFRIRLEDPVRDIYMLSSDKGMALQERINGLEATKQRAADLLLSYAITISLS
jgi:hypothetical protein